MLHYCKSMRGEEELSEIYPHKQLEHSNHVLCNEFNTNGVYSGYI